jgi:hypothetical protein
MSTVWLVHVDKRRDYSAADEHGNVQEVFSSIGRDFDPYAAIEHARRVLQEYQEGDYIVMSGDPTLCSICVTVVAEMWDICQVLRWDKNKLKYDKIILNFSVLR